MNIRIFLIMLLRDDLLAGVTFFARNGGRRKSNGFARILHTYAYAHVTHALQRREKKSNELAAPPKKKKI